MKRRISTHNIRKSSLNFLKICLALIFIILISNQQGITDLNSKGPKSNPQSSNINNLDYVNIQMFNDDNEGDSVGNNDGVLDAGETVEFKILLKNTGGTDLTNFDIELTSTDPYVSFTAPLQNYPLIEAGGTGVSSSFYILSVNSSCPKDHSITFKINETSKTFSLTVEKVPSIIFKSYSVYSENDGDIPADDDGVVDPGEDLTLSLTLENIGGALVSDLSGDIVLKESDLYVQIIKSDVDFNTIFPNDDNYDNFKIDVNGACPDKRKFNFTAVLQDKFNSAWNVDFSIVVNGTAKLEIVNYTLYDDSNNQIDELYIDSYYDFRISFQIRNTGDAACQIDWAILTTESNYINFYETDMYYRNETYFSYDDSIFINETYELFETVYWDFSLKRNIPNNQEIIFKLLIGDSSNNLVHELSLTLTYKNSGTGLISNLGDSLLALIILLAIILVWNRSFIRKKVNKVFWRVMKIFMVFGVFISLFIYTFMPYGWDGIYDLIGFLGVIIPFTVCLYTPGTREFRDKYRSWKADIYNNRSEKWDEIKSKLKNVSNSVQEKKSQIDQEKRAKKENFMNIIAKAHESVEKAQEADSKKEYRKALECWNEALSLYKDGKRKTKSKEEEQKIDETILSINENLIVVYFNSGINLKKQALQNYKKKQLKEAKSKYQKAIEYMERSLEIKEEQNFPNSEVIDENKVKKSINEYKNRIKLFEYIDILREYKETLKQYEHDVKDQENLIDIDSNMNKVLLNLINLEQDIKKQKDPMFGEITIACHKLLQKSRNFKKSLEDKFDQYLGKLSPLSVEKDEDEDDKDTINDRELLGLDEFDSKDLIEKKVISTNEERHLLEKFKKIMKISQEVEMKEVAESLHLKEDELFEKLIEWGGEIPFKIKKNMIVVDDLSAFMGALDKQFTDWENKEVTKEGKKE